MIASLHWADFETLVDLMFARMGWQRVSRVGGSQKDTDLVLIQPATGEAAFVQVKSKAGKRFSTTMCSDSKEDRTSECSLFAIRQAGPS